MENSIILQIDETSRTILNNGKDTPIILGVKGDNCAERVYFESPRYLSDEIDLFDAKDGGSVKVYIDFKNANNEPYIHECTGTVISDEETNKVTFYWLVSHYATVAKGDVKFNVCVKKFNGEDLVAEWHTTMFIGKVLDSVEVSRKTPEVITPTAVTLQALMNQVSDYEAAFDTFNEEIVNAETLVNDLVSQNMSNYALKSTVETLFEGNGTTDRLWALEDVDAWTFYGVKLSKIPTAGSKLRIYISSTADDYYKYKSFVMDLHVLENPTHGAVCGQASHHIVMSFGLMEYVFEGIMHVNFNPGDRCSDTSQDTLYFTLVTKKYDAQTIDDVYDSTLVQFTIDKVEMITGAGI
jgi:hypothetical protein